MNLNSKNPRMRANNLLTLALTVMALVVVSGTGMAQGPTGPCQCGNTTLMNTLANVEYASTSSNNDWNGTVTGAVEMPSGTNALPWNFPQRFNIDLQASKVRIEFAKDSGYSQPGSKFTFNLNPLAPATCGTAKIISSTITTSRPAALAYVSASSSFSSLTNVVTIAFGNTGSNPFPDWKKGDWIEAQLGFECGPTVPPASTCCPPVEGKAFVQAMFRHQGNAGNNYKMVLDLVPPSTTTSFFNGLKAYLTLLNFLCPKTVGLKAEFFSGPVTAPPAIPLGSPAGPLVPADATIPKSSYTIDSFSTVAALNTALTPGMNNFAYSNNQWYRIAVRITGVNAQGQPVNCGFDAKACAMDDTFGFAWPTSGLVAQPPAFTK